jgi:hypothetical protein
MALIKEGPLFFEASVRAGFYWGWTSIRAFTVLQCGGNYELSNNVFHLSVSQKISQKIQHFTVLTN